MRDRNKLSIDTANYTEQVRWWPDSGRHILAQFDDDTIIVYQAYRPAIGLFAAKHGYFGGDFKYPRTPHLFGSKGIDDDKHMNEIDSETGRVTSPKHAVKGEHVVRGVLRNLDCDLVTREEIARLIGFHGRPAFLTERDAPINEVIRLSWMVDNQLLFLFAVADTRGRDTDSVNRPEENLQYWKLLAEEQAT